MKAEKQLRSDLKRIICNSPLRPETRKRKTDSVYRHVMSNSRSLSSGNFKTISSEDLGLMFQITDEQFFDGRVGQLCEVRADRPLSFRLSTRMTSSGGMTTMQTSHHQQKRRYEFEIAIATTPLFSSFRSNETAFVSGIACQNRLQALQRIMEHEMIHLLEMLLWNDSNCSARQFKGIASRFFGHKASNHQLLTPGDLARRNLGIGTGDLVVFDHEGRQMKGHVNRITKRATVLVKNRTGVLYDDGCKYQKFYVPLHRLRRA